MTSLAKKLLPIILIVSLALYSVFPFVENLGGVAVDDYDSLLMVWIYNQNIQKIPSSLGEIFQGNIFYPFEGVMAYSDMHFISSLLNFLPVKLTGEPTSSLAFSFIFGQILTMLVVYFWWKELTNDKWAALLGAVVLGLSQIRMHYLVHLQMWNMQYWLVSVWMIWRYAKNGKIWQLYLAAVFLGLQVWESPLPAFWIVAIGLVLLFPKFAKLIKHWKHLFLMGSIVGFMVFPLLKAYWLVSQEFNYKRTIRDAANFSASVDDFWGIFLSPGLFILFIGLLLSQFEKLRRDKNIKWVAAVFTVGLVMALGPVLKWQGATFKILDRFFIPLPYGVFYYLIPGFGAFRTPSRWIWLFALAASGIIAIGFSKYKKRKDILIFFGLIIAIFAGTRVDNVIKIPTLSEYPPVYEFLEEQPGEVVLELPAYTWAAGDIGKTEVYRMLYSLEHGKKMVNGYSGFSPPSWEIFIAKLAKEFPSDEMVVEVESMGVDYIIVDKNKFTSEKLNEIKIWGEDRLKWEDESHVLYEMLL